MGLSEQDQEILTGFVKLFSEINAKEQKFEEIEKNIDMINKLMDLSQIFFESLEKDIFEVDKSTITFEYAKSEAKENFGLFSVPCLYYQTLMHDDDNVDLSIAFNEITLSVLEYYKNDYSSITNQAASLILASSLRYFGFEDCSSFFSNIHGEIMPKYINLMLKNISASDYSSDETVMMLSEAIRIGIRLEELKSSDKDEYDVYRLDFDSVYEYWHENASNKSKLRDTELSDETVQELNKLLSNDDSNISKIASEILFDHFHSLDKTKNDLQSRYISRSLCKTHIIALNSEDNIIQKYAIKSLLNLNPRYFLMPTYRREARELANALVTIISTPDNTNRDLAFDFFKNWYYAAGRNLLRQEFNLSLGWGNYETEAKLDKIFISMIFNMYKVIKYDLDHWSSSSLKEDHELQKGNLRCILEILVNRFSLDDLMGYYSSNGNDEIMGGIIIQNFDLEIVKQQFSKLGMLEQLRALYLGKGMIDNASQIFEMIEEFKKPKRDSNLTEIKISDSVVYDSKFGAKELQSNGSLIEQLDKIAKLYKEGLLSQEEFEAMKSKLLSG